MTAQTISLRPRLDIGLAPYVDAWLLRRRMVASLSHNRSAHDASMREPAPREYGPALTAGITRTSNAMRRALSSAAPWTHTLLRTATELAAGKSRRRIARVALLSIVALPVATPPALAVIRLASVKATYGKIIADRAGIAVHMGPELAGVIRRPGTRPDTLVLQSRVTADDELYRMYDATEGAGNRFTYFGWPVRSMVRAALCHAGAPIEGECGGASGGIQHLIRGLRGGHGGDRNGFRKILEFTDAPALSLLYPQGDARAALILDNLNFGYLPGGRPLIGVTTVSRVLWAEPDPRNLSLAKKSAILGIFKYPISWDTGEGIHDKGLIARKHALNRARDIVVKTFGRDDPRVAAALLELSQPDFLPTRPVAPLVELGGAVGQVAQEELSELAKAGSKPITDIELTIASPGVQRRYEAGVVRALAMMEQRHDVVRPLLAGNDRADGLAIQTAKDGAITAISATSSRIGLAARRPVGSHGKWVVLLAMARSNRYDADSVLCNRATLDGIQNSGGDQGVTQCSAGTTAGWIQIRTVFGRSMNLPLLSERHLSDDDLRRTAAAVGFTLPATESDPRRSLILGSSAESDPASIIALGNTLSSFANGGEAIGHFPFIIKRIRVDGKWVSPQRRQPLDLRTFLNGDKARRLIAAVCSAPFEGGTLAAFNAPAGPPEGHAGVRCGKSATVAGSRESGYPTISKAIIVSGMDGAWYAYLGAPKGVLGSRTLSILPYARAAHQASVTRARSVSGK